MTRTTGLSHISAVETPRWFNRMNYVLQKNGLMCCERYRRGRSQLFEQWNRNESTTLKVWTLTASQKLENSHRILHSCPLGLFLTVHATFITSWMEALQIHELEYMTQQVGQQNLPTYPHSTLTSENLKRMKCFRFLCPAQYNVNKELQQQSKISFRSFLATSDNVWKFDCLLSF